MNFLRGSIFENTILERAISSKNVLRNNFDFFFFFFEGNNFLRKSFENIFYEGTILKMYFLKQKFLKIF